MKTLPRLLREVLQVLKPDPARLYTYLHPPIVPGVAGDFSAAHELKLKTGREPLWVNLGYWRDIESCTVENYARWPELLTRAQENLATLLAETAKLAESDEILDCGFGYGDQDIFWLEKYKPQRIVGINITEEHVRVASERARLLGFEDHLDFQHASATKIPFSSKMFDVVLALESAFHFDTREAFVQEAARVLKPGGRIAIADMFCKEPPNVSPPRRLVQNLFRRRCHVPYANLWTREKYRNTLEGLGFRDISIMSIAEDVYRPFRRQWVQFDKDPSADKIRKHLERVDGLSPDQFPWKRLVGIDEYAIVFGRAS